MTLLVLQSCREAFAGYNGVVQRAWCFVVCGGRCLNLLCCVYQSVPNHFRLSLPCLQKSFDVSSPRCGLCKGCTELLGRGRRICLSFLAHSLEAQMLWSGGEADTEVPCSVAEQGLQVALTLSTGLGWLELAPGKCSVSISSALVLERYPKRVRLWKEHWTQADLWCNVYRVLCCQF